MSGLNLRAQRCSGNLGENIFTEGDFGSGAANIPPNDPMIAPGFIYQRNPPPNDGFYTITNDMRPWNNPWGDWRAFPDNSNDPQGYMMVVNAAFAPGLFYEQRVDGLCENTSYQFSADITNIYFRNRNGILPNVSFLLDGEVVFNTGDIAEDELWHTYDFLFATEPGQTEVTLALRNNAPGGIGNDLALDNIAFRACGPEALIAGEEIIRICEDGEPTTLMAEINGSEYDAPAIQWQRSLDEGSTWTDIAGGNAFTFLHTELSSGFYHYRYLLANGASNLANTKCRVVSSEKVVYVVPKRYEIFDTLCVGRSFNLGDQSFDRTGIFEDTLLSSLGCDSIVTLNLQVNPDPGLSADFVRQDPSCSYLSDGSIQLLGVTNAAPPVSFYFQDSLRTNRLFPNLPEGDYDYRIVDRYGCTTAGQLNLSSPFPFTVDLGDDLNLRLGEEARIFIETADDIVSFQWAPVEAVTCTDDCNPLLFRPEESLTLYLEATSVNGCLASDSVAIKVVKVRDVYAPNAFSPNGDGVNDAFTLYGGVPNVRQMLKLQIFDRWGSLVFQREGVEINNPGVGWDGNRQGQLAPVGTYTYAAEILFLDGAIMPISGSFMLVR
ncbi:MAG: gliding motility-associated C-terminal domain-containing protein [Bacteroidota bacterium]